MIKPWPRLRSTRLADYRIFSVRSDVKTSPRTGREHDFYVLDTTDWVNVIAITPDQKLVMVEQYRHGSETVELEIPGGMLDPGETSPVEGGLRELREETGYVGARARLIGRIFPNPAIMSNVCHTLLVEDCAPATVQEMDPMEDLRTVLIDIGELPQLVAKGKIQHALVVVALYHFELACRSAR